MLSQDEDLQDLIVLGTVQTIIREGRRKKKKKGEWNKTEKEKKRKWERQE